MCRKFEIGFFCMGNGLTVCNRAVMEHGDYKTVAWISPAGKIHYRASEKYVPAWAMEKIRSHAENLRWAFVKNFESLPEGTQYFRILDSVPTGNMLEFLNLPGTISEKLPAMRKYYYSIS